MDMEFDEIKAAADVLLGKTADAIRTRYVMSFVDTTTSVYRERIATTQSFSDGQYYMGYLWDCLKRSRLITEEEALRSLSRKPKPLYVMWDLHSNERIYIKDYWKFPKKAVLKLAAKDLVAGRQFLPEDVYIFDDSFEWSIIFTHEYFGNQQRDCRTATP